MNVGRNELCPCGSGKKFKNCHEGKGRSRDLYLLAAVGAVALLGLIALFMRRGGDETPASRVTGGAPMSARTAAPAAAPSAATPASPVATQPMAGTPNLTPTATQAQPGPAPAGKVWSPEHNHWHDVPAGTTLPPPTAQNPIQITTRPPAPAPLTPQPPGPVPPGKVWSAEHGHWHDVPKQ